MKKGYIKPQTVCSEFDMCECMMGDTSVRVGERGVDVASSEFEVEGKGRDDAWGVGLWE